MKKYNNLAVEKILEEGPLAIYQLMEKKNYFSSIVSHNHQPIIPISIKMKI